MYFDYNTKFMFKYNYVLFWGDSNLYKLIYKDLSNTCYSNILSLVPDNIFLKIIYKLHHSGHIRKFIKLPLLKLWYPFYCRNIKFKDTKKPICFVFLSNSLELDYIRNFVCYLKKKYPTSKNVCYYTDIVKAPHRIYLKEPQNIKELFDLLVTYDENDAKDYNMLYSPTSFSNIEMNDVKCSSSDVYYLGLMKKGRYEIIISIYNQLKKLGLSCDFWLLGVDKSMRKEMVGIHYLDHPISYEENLKRVSKSKFLLELIQPDSVGYTLRLWEAINYNKPLITNNIFLKESIFYDKRFISFINKGNNVDPDFIINYRYFNNTLKDLIRPINFLIRIDENL